MLNCQCREDEILFRIKGTAQFNENYGLLCDQNIFRCTEIECSMSLKTKKIFRFVVSLVLFCFYLFVLLSLYCCCFDTSSHYGEILFHSFINSISFKQ